MFNSTLIPLIIINIIIIFIRASFLLFSYIIRYIKTVNYAWFFMGTVILISGFLILKTKIAFILRSLRISGPLRLIWLYLEHLGVLVLIFYSWWHRLDTVLRDNWVLIDCNDNISVHLNIRFVYVLYFHGWCLAWVHNKLFLNLLLSTFISYHTLVMIMLIIVFATSNS